MIGEKKVEKKRKKDNDGFFTRSTLVFHPIHTNLVPSKLERKNKEENDLD